MSEAPGNGVNAIKYIAAYTQRGFLSERDILSYDEKTSRFVSDPTSSRRTVTAKSSRKRLMLLNSYNFTSSMFFPKVFKVSVTEVSRHPVSGRSFMPLRLPSTLSRPLKPSRAILRKSSFPNVVLYLYRLILYRIRIIRLFQTDYWIPKPSVPHFWDSTNNAISIYPIALSSSVPAQPFFGASLVPSFSRCHVFRTMSTTIRRCIIAGKELLATFPRMNIKTHVSPKRVRFLNCIMPFCHK